MVRLERCLVKASMKRLDITLRDRIDPGPGQVGERATVLLDINEGDPETGEEVLVPGYGAPELCGVRHALGSSGSPPPRESVLPERPPAGRPDLPRSEQALKTPRLIPGRIDRPGLAVLPDGHEPIAALPRSR